MKAPALKIPKLPEPPVFPISIRKRVVKSNGADSTKSLKRDNIFSQSRDTREDRGARQMKTAHNPQTFSHGH
jgi:hypothetical protein